MKYTASNKPMECMQTHNRCYTSTGKAMKIKGLLIHSTGANNPTLKRYVQPSAEDPNRAALLAKIGRNTNGNDWNRDGQYVTDKNGKRVYQKLSAGLNGWIGKLADGTVVAVKTMPDNYRPWGCGSGPRGSCNDGWLQVEICEDGLTDPAYFAKAYQEAVELFAYWCTVHGLDPNGTTTLNGVKVPVILDHTTSHALGLGSNHGDVGHWFPRHGKSIKTFRADIAKALGTTTKPAETTTATGSASGLEYPSGAIKHRELFQLLREAGLTEIGAAALMGNLYAESGLAANNLQNNGNVRLKLSDAEFTAKLDSGAYSREKFIGDKYGYGLAQWTYPTRKAAFYDWMAKAKKGFGDEQTQAAFLVHELKTSYKAVWAALTGGATTIREASDIVMLQYEAPADKSEEKRKQRAQYGQDFYEKYAQATKPSKPATGAPTAPAASKPYIVKVTASALNIRKGPGTGYAVTGVIRDKGTYTITEERSGWGKLKSGAGWISLSYVKKI